MDLEEDDFKIQRIFDDYIQRHTEMQNIKKDIQQYQKQYKHRVDILKMQQKEAEETVLSYLEKHQLPGIRKGDFILMAEGKSIPLKKKSKKDRIQSILQTYQIDIKSPLAQDLSSLVENTKQDGSRMKYIKCKEYH